jgi:outer membrane protein TolC
MNPTTLLLTLALAAAAASAQTNAVTSEFLPMKLDLPAVRQLALENNQAIRVAAKQVDEQEGAVVIAGAPLKPQVGVTAGYTITDEDRIESFGPAVSGNDEFAAGEITLRQVLYGGGRLDPARKAALEGKAAREFNLAATTADVLLQVHVQYYDVLLNKARIGVQEESIRLFAEQLAIASNRYASGSGPKFDVIRARVSLANAEPPLIRAKNAYRLAIDALRQTVGLPYAPGRDASGIEFDNRWEVTSLPADLANAVGVALTNRPEIAAIRRQQAAATLQVQVARRTRNPEIGAYAGYGAVTRRFGSGFEDPLYGWQAGLQADWPLFDGGLERGQVIQAASRLQQLELLEEQLRLAIENEVRRAVSDCEESSEILRTSELVIEQADEAVRLADNRFQAGVATQLDVLDAQLELTRAKLEHIVATRNYNAAAAQLKRAMGAILAAP